MFRKLTILIMSLTIVSCITPKPSLSEIQTGIAKTIIAAPTATETSIPTLTPTVTSSSTVTITPSMTPTSTPTQISTITVTQTPTPVTFRNLSEIQLRAGPGLNYPIIGKALVKELITILARNNDSTWLLIGTYGPWSWSLSTAWGWVSINTIQYTSSINEIIISTQILSTPTKTLIPSPTPIPTYTVVQIFNNYKSMSAFQFEQYKKSIIGKKVVDQVKVLGVDKYGRVLLTGPWIPPFTIISDFCAVIVGVPPAIAIKLNYGNQINFEATINAIIGNYNYYFDCENTLVLSYISIK